MQKLHPSEVALYFVFFLLPFGLLGKVTKGHQNAIREVSASSCEIIEVNLALGMTTQIVLEQKPEATLYTNQTRFQISSNDSAPRSLALIPQLSAAEASQFNGANGKMPGGRQLMDLLNKSFATNLFVFFKNNNQLTFHLRFVTKESADYILKVKQTFPRDCAL